MKATLHVRACWRTGVISGGVRKDCTHGAGDSTTGPDAYRFRRPETGGVSFEAHGQHHTLMR